MRESPRVRTTPDCGTSLNFSPLDTLWSQVGHTMVIDVVIGKYLILLRRS